MEIVIAGEPPLQPEIATNAYVYPFADEETIRTTLPYLTYLSIFSYGIEPDGSLVMLNGDEWLIELARQYGATPVMMLTSLSQEGYFSNELAMQVLSNAQVQDILIDNIADTMAEKGYGAVDVDFEYISNEYAEAYAAFLAKLREKVEPLGFEVFAALAPKSADQSGLLYEGHDYRLIGDAVDAVQLMTYEWAFTYGPPMAVSPCTRYGCRGLRLRKSTMIKSCSAFRITGMTGRFPMFPEQLPQPLSEIRRRSGLPRRSARRYNTIPCLRRPFSGTSM